MDNYKFFAFISYNSRDTEWGKRVQRKLEGYRMPSTLCSEHGWKRKPISPVFFAPTDIQPGGLSAELQERLRASRHLIVICSPNSAKSEWVAREIEYFHSLGRTANIHFFIVDGVPHGNDSATECFNPVVERLGLPEILGANVNEKVYRCSWLNRERAYVQLITKLLGVEFDSIWQRHRRLLRQKLAITSILILGVISALVGVWVANQPVDIGVNLCEATVHNPELPPLKDAVVTMRLDDEVKTDTVSGIDASALFLNVPHRFLDKDVEITVKCNDWLDLDTVMKLNRKMSLPMRRDASVYGRVRFSLWNPTTETAVANCPLKVNGIDAVSDSNGVVETFVPLERQRTVYKIESSVALENDSLPMPSGEYDAVFVK